MPKQSPILEMVGIQRHYAIGENIVKALDDVNLTVDKGEFLTIVGSSGSGKSTLLNLLGCLDKPSGGEYRIGGHTVSDLEDEPLSRLRNRRIGFVFQEFNLLYDLTVEENIALPLVYSGMGREERLTAAARYAEMLGIGGRRQHQPTEISGGEAQRVAIARALVTDPDIILADEPTGNLDSRTGRDIMNVLHDLNKRGYTIIMVTHDQKYADEGTRKITISDGKVIGDTRIRDLEVVELPEPGQGSTSRDDAADDTMSFIDLVRIGVREGLLAHKTRTALTMLGIVIGVAGVVAMSSFSLGSKKKQENQIRALGANLVRVVDNRLEGEKLADARVRGSKGLSLDDLYLLQDTVPNIVQFAAMRDIKLNVMSEAGNISPRVVGVEDQYLEVNNLELSDGRFIGAHDQDRCARVAVVGSAIARQLGTNEIGKVLMMGGTPYTVVGTLANKQIDLRGLEATGVSDPNYDVLVPLQTILTRTKHLGMRSQVDELHLQLDTEDSLYEAGTSIRRVLTLAHSGVEDFKLVIPLDLLRQKQQAQRLLDILTICISSIALLVGGIGIMNIMLASVTERIREIGIRRTVGATRKYIVYQFLSESVLIAATGGLAGVLFALVGVSIACALLDLPIVISPGMVTVAVLASTCVGLGFGLYPAAKAAERSPVEALRYE